MSPCFTCQSCDCCNCPNRIFANREFNVTDTVVENLWKEITDIAFVEDTSGELVLDQFWRGFPVGEFTQDDWFYWVDAHHSKGVGWVYENISPYANS